MLKIIFAISLLIPINSFSQVVNKHLEINNNGTISGMPPPPFNEIKKGGLTANDTQSTISETKIKNLKIEFNQFLSVPSSGIQNKISREIFNKNHAPEAKSSYKLIQLTFKPKATPQEDIEIGASPAGTLIGNSWTGVDRYFKRADGSRYKITEYDFSKTDGKLYLSNQSTGLYVRNTPAGVASFSNNEEILTEVVWVSSYNIFTMVSLLTMNAGQIQNRSSDATSTNNAILNKAMAISNALIEQ